MPIDVPGGSPTVPTSRTAGTVTPASPGEGAGGPGDQGSGSHGNPRFGGSPQAADRQAAQALRSSPAVQVNVSEPPALQSEDGPGRMQAAARGERATAGAPSAPQGPLRPGALHPLQAALLQIDHAERAARAARTSPPTRRAAARAAAGAEGTLLVRLVVAALHRVPGQTTDQRTALALLQTFAEQGAGPTGVRPEFLTAGTLSELRGALEALLPAAGVSAVRSGDRRVLRSPDGTYTWTENPGRSTSSLGNLALRLGVGLLAAGSVVLWLSWLR